MKRALWMLAGLSAALAGCGSSGESSADQKAVAPVKPKKAPAFCFFKDPEMKGWTVKRDPQGNVVLTGKAHVKDSRYEAVMGPPDISGATASIAPTLNQNMGYEAPDDWWDLKTTIPASAAVTKVTISCGARTVASLDVPPKTEPAPKS